MSGIAGRLFQRIFPLSVTEILEFAYVTAIHDSSGLFLSSILSVGGDRFIENESRDASIMFGRIFNVVSLISFPIAIRKGFRFVYIFVFFFNSDHYVQTRFF